MNLYLSSLGSSCLNSQKGVWTLDRYGLGSDMGKLGHVVWSKSFFRGSHVKAQTHVGSHKFNWEQNCVSYLQSCLSCFFCQQLFGISQAFYLCHLAEQVTYLRHPAAPMATTCCFFLGAATTLRRNILLMWSGLWCWWQMQVFLIKAKRNLVNCHGIDVKPFIDITYVGRSFGT